jgi:hypothetical protein
MEDNSMKNKQIQAQLTSVISYPDRGHWGDSKYRGNCSGHVIKGLLEHYKPHQFLEIFAGGGTGHSVAREMGYKDSIHLDLNPRWGGFNALSDDIPEGSDFVFLHPPYHDIIVYSGKMWGEAHPDDLSRCASYDEFIKKLDKVHAKVYSSLRKGGRYAVLVGDCKRKGDYFSIMKDISYIGKLESHIIKLQHNCVSDSFSYNGRFIPIMHENLLIFCKDDFWVVPVSFVKRAEQDLRHSQLPTWRDLVQAALEELGGKANLRQLYDSLGGSQKAQKNPHWQEKIRQTLQLGKEFESNERGTWQLSARNNRAA